MLVAAVVLVSLFVHHGMAAGALGVKIGAVLGVIIGYAGLVFWIRGCCGYAFSKGRSRWLGMVALSGPVGLILIALLPPKPSTAAG